VIALEYLLLVCGVGLLILVWWIPQHIEGLRNHGGGYFTSGAQSLGTALTSLTATFSILFAIAAAFISLPVYETKGVLPTALGVITFLIFSAGIVFSLYLALVRPLSGTAPTTKQFYWPLRLLLLGLGFSMFTLASFL